MDDEMNSSEKVLGEALNDAWNQEWRKQVFPEGWKQPTPRGNYNLVVLGGGTAGLVTAAGAAGLGARVALIERQWMGGDCLNVGCVPSKTLIAAAREAFRAGAVSQEGVRERFRQAMERVRRVRAEISPHDSAERFRALGVDVYLGEGRFTGESTVEVAGTELKFAKAVIATGGKAAVPSIPGLVEVGYYTHETLFNLTELPMRMMVLGAGPIGCELAQAFHRLGSRVVVIHRGKRILEKELPEASEVIHKRLAAEGVEFRLGAQCERVEKTSSGVRMIWVEGGREHSTEVDAILVAVGRIPNVKGLGLESAGVDYDELGGVKVDDFLRTTQRRIYAAGDVCMATKFTHAADFGARLVIQNALFMGRKRVSALNVPRCTYTEPEVAHTGLNEGEARKRGFEVTTWTRDFREVDRAKTEGDTDGFVRLWTVAGSGRILGGTVVGSGAGDLISELSVAMASGVSLGRLASVIHPYPTRAEAIRQLGDAFNRTRLTPRIKALFELWLRWSR